MFLQVTEVITSGVDGTVTAVVAILTEETGVAGCVTVTMAEEATTETIAVVAIAGTTIVGPTTEMPAVEDIIETEAAVQAIRTIGIGHRLVSFFMSVSQLMMGFCYRITF